MRFLLAENSHQHVRARDFLLAGGLHVKHGALQHPLEAQCRLRIARVVGVQQRGILGDELCQIALQPFQIGRTGSQHGAGGRIVQQRQQQVLDRHELITLLARPFESTVQGEF
jgi:hypothetical protein